MPHRVCFLVALAVGPAGLHPRLAGAADAPLPSGAVLRLGDTRFRAGGPVADLTFSTDGTELASRVPLDDATTRVTVWQVGTGRPLATTTEPRRPGTQARWRATSFPDSTLGIDLGPDGVPVVRDYKAERDLARLTGHCARVTAVSVSPDGKRIATASADGLIRVWDAATFRPLIPADGHTAAVLALEVSPDGRLALSTGADRAARVWNLATGKEVRAFPLPPGARPNFTPDGAAVRVPLPDRVTLRDLVTGLEIVTSNIPDPPPEPLPLMNALLRQLGACAAVSPDGRTVAVGDGTGAVSLYEAATGQVRRRLAGHGGPCLDLVFTPDGSRLLTAGADHAVLVWGVRVRDVPLPEAVKRETSAAKLWAVLTTGHGAEAYRAAARLAADPAAAVTMARLRARPGVSAGGVADARVVELLEAVGSVEARAVLRELAADDADAVRSRAASAALTRLGEAHDPRGGIRTISGSRP